jgi:hypothetical protein
MTNMTVDIEDLWADYDSLAARERRAQLRDEWRNHHLEQADFWRRHGEERAAYHEARAAKYARR